MNEDKNKIKSSAEDVLERYKENVSVPKDGLVRLLNALPKRDQTRAVFPWKIFIPAMVAIILVIAGFTLHRPSQTAPTAVNNPPPASTLLPPTNASDASIDQEVNAIDSQLSGLSADESDTDQALNNQYQ